jgi:energy-converting hydrogenase Eha subunit A
MRKSILGTLAAVIVGLPGAVACAVPSAPARDPVVATTTTAAAVATTTAAAAATPTRQTLLGVTRVVAVNADSAAGGGNYQQVLVVGSTSYILLDVTPRPNRMVRLVGLVTGDTVEVESIEDLGPA